MSRCRFGKINMFGGFHVLIWRVCQSNYDRKKDTVVWPLVGMFGGSMSSDCFGGFLDQITTGKIGTGNLQIGMALSIK